MRSRALGSAQAGALELDEKLTRAHGILGDISHLYDWDWEAAKQHFRRAAELHASDPGGWGLTFWLVSTGRFEEALIQSRRNIQHDPLALDSHARHAFVLLLARRFTESAHHCRLILELKPNYSEAYRFLGHALELLGSLEESREAFDRAVALSHGHPWSISGLARTLARLGRGDEITAHVAALAAGVDNGSAPATALAHVQAIVNPDAAFQWLERGIEERDLFLVFLRVNPLLDGLRHDPRFERLVQRVGIPLLASG
jgi:tetratricopeptide (TPR) repeat protein